MKNTSKLKITFLSVLSAVLFSIPAIAQKAKPNKFLENKLINKAAIPITNDEIRTNSNSCRSKNFILIDLQKS